MKQVIKEIEVHIEKSQLALEKLEEATKDNTKKNYIPIIRNNIQKLINLTQRILDDNELLTFEYLNIKEVIQEELQSLETYLEKKHITLEFNGDDVYAQVSKEALERILTNLLSNAIKYNKKNGIIQIVLSQKEDNAVLQIIDSGIGISETYMDELFTKFSREKSNEEGSGLGLSIVKALTELHNGTIECFSKLGKGTTIQVTLPITHISNQMDNAQKLGDRIISLSHELKTPIHVMQSALDVMRLSYQDAPEILELMNTLKYYSNQILNAIQLIINVQKIKDNYLNFQFKTYNLVEVIENVIDVFSESNKGYIIFDPQEEEIYVKIDLTTIQQALILFIQFLQRQNVPPIWTFYLESNTLILSINKPVEELDKNASDFLMLQFIELILEKHQATYSINNNQISIYFKECKEEKVIALSEENKFCLRKQLKMNKVYEISKKWE